MQHSPLTAQEIKQKLNDIGVDLIEPESEKEEIMAEAFDNFSSFILDEEPEKCREILDKHMDEGSSVGELQGGSDQHIIYRVSIANDANDDNDDNAVSELLDEFHSSYQGKRYSSVLTIKKLKWYMLRMCERRQENYEHEYDNSCPDQHARKYKKLENFMFILSFGPITGQVRHIDNMVPNLQICLYMSSDCLSTIVYVMDGVPITNVNELVDYWEENEVLLSSQKNPHVPDFLKKILLENGDMALKSKWYTKYFAFWDTININLNCFGKLYQPVSHQLSLTTRPGTTLLAGGNEVHAGPPSEKARMFAFAIGVLENGTFSEDENEDNNGEVQYSPVLLHVDLCCILFSIIDYEYSDEKVQDAKLYLLDVLITLAKDFPKVTYDRHIDDERSELRDWLGQIVETLGDKEALKRDKLIEEALKSDTIFYSPDVKKRRMKKKKRRNAKLSSRI